MLYGIDDINDVAEIIIVFPLLPLWAAIPLIKSLTHSLLIFLFLILGTG
jgi:hypothetical protein